MSNTLLQPGDAAVYVLIGVGMFWASYLFGTLIILYIIRRLK